MSDAQETIASLEARLQALVEHYAVERGEMAEQLSQLLELLVNEAASASLGCGEGYYRRTSAPSETTNIRCITRFGTRRSASLAQQRHGEGASAVNACT